MADPFSNFFHELQADPGVQNVVGTFDTLLGALTSVGPVPGRVVPSNSVGEREKLLSEIDRQLFLQFLEGEITYLKTKHSLTALSLYHRVAHDREFCRRKQVQIRAALTRLLLVQQIDKPLYSAMMAERLKTFTDYVGMKFTEHYGWNPTIDVYIDAHETSAVRKIMEQLLDLWLNSDDLFVAHDAWADLRDRWDAWASKHHNRVAALKQYWVATGGGKDPKSNPAGIQVINDYYAELYGIIENGDNLANMIKKLLGP